MPPGFARAGAVAEAVQFLADLHVRLALTPQFDGLGVDISLDSPEFMGHSGTAMLHRHYAHLGARAKALREALGRVR